MPTWAYIYTVYSKIILSMEDLILEDMNGFQNIVYLYVLCL